MTVWLSSLAGVTSRARSPGEVFGAALTSRMKTGGSGDALLRRPHGHRAGAALQAECSMRTLAALHARHGHRDVPPLKARA